MFDIWLEDLKTQTSATQDTTAENNPLDILRGDTVVLGASSLLFIYYFKRFILFTEFSCILMISVSINQLVTVLFPVACEKIQKYSCV